MTNINEEFLPEWTSPPGETIAELMVAHGYSKEIMAMRLGLTLDWFNAILAGWEPLDITTIDGLFRLFGPSREFWQNRDQQYWVDKERLG